MGSMTPTPCACATPSPPALPDLGLPSVKGAISLGHLSDHHSVLPEQQLHKSLWVHCSQGKELAKDVFGKSHELLSERTAAMARRPE